MGRLILIRLFLFWLVPIRRVTPTTLNRPILASAHPDSPTPQAVSDASFQFVEQFLNTECHLFEITI